MIIGFSTTSTTDYATGDHLAHYPDLITFEVSDFSPTTKNYSIKESKGKWQLVTEDKPVPPESTNEKHKRIHDAIVSAESIEDFDLEGEMFSDREIGDIIVERVFDGNHHAQTALIAKIQSMLVSGEANQVLVSQANTIQTKINEVRNLFNLGNL